MKVSGHFRQHGLTDVLFSWNYKIPGYGKQKGNIPIILRRFESSRRRSHTVRREQMCATEVFPKLKLTG